MKVQLQQFGLLAFWQWWIAELQELIPDKVWRWFQLQRSVVLVQVTHDELLVSRYFEDRPDDIKYQKIAIEQLNQRMVSEVLLGDLDSSLTRLILCLPQKKVLVKKLRLPQVLAQNLRQSLQFEIDRYTPFQAHQVYFDCQVVQHLADKQQIDVLLILAPKTLVTGCMERLDQYGFRLDGIDVAKVEPWDGRQQHQVNLLPKEDLPERKKTWDGLNLVLSLIIVVLLGIAIGVPIWNQDQTQQQLEAELLIATKAAKQANHLRNQMDEIMQKMQFVLQKKQQQPTTIEALNELTLLLPDNSWVHFLEQDGTEIRMQGKSPEASALLAKMEQSRYFHQAKFRSPITRDSKTGLERFHLSMELVVKQAQTE